MSRGRKVALFGVCALAAILPGCGGGTRQDKAEPGRDFMVSVVRAEFPSNQSLAQASQMNITVKNEDTATIPNVAVTVDGFSKDSAEPGLADPSRPLFIVDNGPSGADTVYKGTWALGALAPGASKTFSWHVTATRAGNFQLHYRVAAGLNGKAVAKLSGGGIPQGAFKVAVSATAPQARVDPNTGRVIKSAPPAPATGQGAAGSTSGGPRVTGTRTAPPPPGY